MEKKRGVKKGTKRGSYKGGIKRKMYSLRLSDAEKARLNALRGKLTVSEYIRTTLGIQDPEKGDF